MTSHQTVRWVLKPLVFAASLAPAGWLVWAAYTGNLSPDPLADITHGTGDWTIRFLCITLAVTPLRRLTGWNAFVRFRRMAGLFAFFYGTLHFLIYMLADRLASLVEFPDGVISWDTAHRLLASIWEDVAMRLYITVGFTALVLMVPLAVTSTAGWIRRLGGKKWRALHRLVYASAILGVDPLLVAGEGGHSRSGDVCGHRSGLARFPSLSVAAACERRGCSRRT